MVLEAAGVLRAARGGKKGPWGGGSRGGAVIPAAAARRRERKQGRLGSVAWRREREPARGGVGSRER